VAPLRDPGPGLDRRVPRRLLRDRGKDSCKGQEVLHYKDPTAGKKGPFALMMHNGGLFDEYKDIWVETDPVGDELVSTK
jgi:hypothetical protein